MRVRIFSERILLTWPATVPGPSRNTTTKTPNRKNYASG